MSIIDVQLIINKECIPIMENKKRSYEYLLFIFTEFVLLEHFVQ
jgi:hypothetical protein